MSLKDEIQGDPLGRGYAGMTPEQVLADLQSKYRTESAELAGEELLRWLAGKGKMSIIEDLKTDGDQAKRNLALTISQLIARPNTAIDPRKNTDASLMQYARSIGVLTADEMAELAKLASQPCSRLKELGLPVPRLREIRAAQEPD